MLALLIALAIQGGAPDPGAIDPVKENAAVVAAAKDKASKALAFKAAYSMIESDSVKDSSVGSNGTILVRFTPADAKKKLPAAWAVAIDDGGVMDQDETKFKASFGPKSLLTVWPAKKEGEQIDPAKDKTLRYWPLLGTPFGELLKDYDAKLVRLATKYELSKTPKSSQGGESNTDEEAKRIGKPSFDGWRSHIYLLTPKNAAVAAQCKKISVSVDMEHYLLTRVELDWKGDGMKKSSINLKEVDVVATLDDASFTLDTTGYKITKK